MKKIIFIIMGILILITACARPPTEEINRAVEALNRAENDSAAVNYAANTLNRARDALARMQVEVNSKRFDSARIFASDVINFSERAINEGQAAVARARDDATGLLASIRTLITETETAVYTAISNDFYLDLDALEQNFDSAINEFENAMENLQANNYQEAVESGQRARSALSSITGNISEAAQALSGKR